MNRFARYLIFTILFIEALDATMLYIALPKITLSFQEKLLEGDWVIIGFILSVAFAMLIGDWLGEIFGLKKPFLYSQLAYIGASVACGFAKSLDQLVIFRILQGAFAGIIIQIGINYWLQARKKHEGHFKGSQLYLYEMIFALGIGPIYAGFVMQYFRWPWLFFLKVPISLLCFFFSIYLLEKQPSKEKKPFNWRNYAMACLAVFLLLFAITEVAEVSIHWSVIIFLFPFSLATLWVFIRQEMHSISPILNFHFFKDGTFAIGMALQSLVMMIFLGAIYVLSLFAIGGLKFSVMETGLIIASLAPGVLVAQLFVKIFKEIISKKGLIIFGLAILSLSMFLLTKVERDTSKLWIAFIVFLEGFGAGLFRIKNANVLFHKIKENELEETSKLYSFINQIMIAFGVAVTTMFVEVNLLIHNISSLSWAMPDVAKRAYEQVFVFLAILPLIGILGAFFYKTNPK